MKKFAIFFFMSAVTLIMFSSLKNVSKAETYRKSDTTIQVKPDGSSSSSASEKSSNTNTIVEPNNENHPMVVIKPEELPETGYYLNWAISVFGIVLVALSAYAWHMTKNKDTK
ncbi:hypothetical protein [Weissella oryzae]|nr:hypothetical protein [Weissella oryzae]